MRLKAVYGAEYKRHYPDEESVTLAKREWAKQIGAFSRDQIDKMFAYVKSEMTRGNDDYQWLNIGAVVSVLTNNWQHAMIERADRERLQHQSKALPNLTAVERVRQKGKAEIAKIKEQFGFKD